MSSISFFTPVTYGGKYRHTGEMLLEKFDDYFPHGGRKASVIRGNKIGDSQGVEYIEGKFALLSTALKVASYVTLIIPLVALIGKAILRSIYHFHLFQQPIQNLFPPNCNGSSNGFCPPPPSSSLPPDDLEFNRIYSLKAEEISQYKLRATMGAVSTSTRGAIFPICNRAVSELGQYSNSYFYFERDRWSGGYELERRLEDDFSPPRFSIMELADSKDMMKISKEEFAELSLTPSNSEGNRDYVYGTSSLPQYRGLEFFWKKSDDESILITAVYENPFDQRIRIVERSYN